MAKDLISLYRRVFSGQENYIPLVVSPPLKSPGLVYPTSRQFTEDTSRAIEIAVKMRRPRLATGSDWVPTVNISHYQGMVVPSLVGAELSFQEGSQPMAKRSPRPMKDLLKTMGASVEGPIVDAMLNTLRTAIRELPPDFKLSFPVTVSPFDIAQLMFGEEFLVASMVEPEMVTTFLMRLADVCIGVIDLVKREMGEAPNESVTNRGLFFPGLRMACDALVTLSPDLIHKIALPVLERFGERYGNLCIHVCTAPSPAKHILPVLLDAECVKAVDNWQGPQVFMGDDAPARLQDKIAVITDADLASEEKMQRFMEWEPVRRVPRRNGRGMVVSASSTSIDHGRWVYERWQEYFR